MMRKSIHGLLAAAAVLLLAGCSMLFEDDYDYNDSGSENSEYSDSGSSYRTYGDFGITESVFPCDSDWDAIVESTFGSNYRVADWNDLESYHAADKNLLTLFSALGLTDVGDSVSLKRSGSTRYSSSRYYFASRHEHVKPSGYLAHENINNYLVSLGSWGGSRKILAVKKTSSSSPEGDSGDDEDSGNSSLQLLKTSNSFQGTTNSSGSVTLDTSSFSKPVVLKVTDPNGAPISSVRVSYVQKNGLAAVKVSDSDKYYAPVYYFGNIRALTDEDSRIVVSSGALIITLGMTLYSSFGAGDALAEIVDFHLENLVSSSLSTSTYIATVDELVSFIRNLKTVASLPLTVAGNIKTLTTGIGMKKTIVKALHLASKETEDALKWKIIQYLINETQKLINGSSELRITIHHMSLASNSVFPYYNSFTTVSSSFEQDMQAIEIELVDANEEEYDGGFTVVESDVSFSSNYAYFTLQIHPKVAGVAVKMSLSGTDGYTQNDTADTGGDGKVQFSVPAGKDDVRDTATISIPASGFTKTFAWTY